VGFFLEGKDFEKAMTMNPIDGKDAIEIAIKGEGEQKGAHIKKTFNEDDLDKPGKFKILLKKYPKFREKYLSTSLKKDGFSMPEPTRSNDPNDPLGLF
jgi:hypothetical protein